MSRKYARQSPLEHPGFGDDPLGMDRMWDREPYRAYADADTVPYGWYRNEDQDQHPSGWDYNPTPQAVFQRTQRELPANLRAILAQAAGSRDPLLQELVESVMAGDTKGIGPLMDHLQEWGYVGPDEAEALLDDLDDAVMLARGDAVGRAWEKHDRQTGGHRPFNLPYRDQLPPDDSDEPWKHISIDRHEPRANYVRTWAQVLRGLRGPGGPEPDRNIEYEDWLDDLETQKRGRELSGELPEPVPMSPWNADLMEEAYRQKAQAREASHQRASRLAAEAAPDPRRTAVAPDMLHHQQATEARRAHAATQRMPLAAGAPVGEPGGYPRDHLRHALPQAEPLKAPQYRSRQGKKGRKRKMAAPVWPHPYISGFTQDEEALLQQLLNHPDPQVQDMADRAFHHGDAPALFMLHDALLDAGESPDSTTMGQLEDLMAFSARFTGPQGNYSYVQSAAYYPSRGADSPFNRQASTINRGVISGFMAHPHSRASAERGDARQAEMAARPLPHDTVQAPRKYSGLHSPPGGVVVRGLFYPGGKFIPGKGPEKSHYDQWSHIEGQRKYRRADGSCDVDAALKDRALKLEEK